LSEDFFPLFNRLKSKGLLFAAASGRQFYNILNRFESVKDDMVFVAENGSYVVYKSEELLVQDMEPAIVKELLEIARNIKDVNIILCGKKRAYVESVYPPFMQNLQMYYDRYEVVEDLMQVTDDQFLKIAICDLAGSEKNSYHHFKHKQDQLQGKNIEVLSGSIYRTS
jgi:hydroxymethylpyrimidine pyrophosphatase-like HAD family hydrolase